MVKGLGAAIVGFLVLLWHATPATAQQDLTLGVPAAGSFTLRLTTCNLSGRNDVIWN